MMMLMLLLITMMEYHFAYNHKMSPILLLRGLRNCNCNWSIYSERCETFENHYFLFCAAACL